MYCRCDPSLCVHRAVISDAVVVDSFTEYLCLEGIDVPDSRMCAAQLIAPFALGELHCIDKLSVIAVHIIIASSSSRAGCAKHWLLLKRFVAVSQWFDSAVYRSARWCDKEDKTMLKEAKAETEGIRDIESENRCHQPPIISASPRVHCFFCLFACVESCHISLFLCDWLLPVISAD